MDRRLLFHAIAITALAQQPSPAAEDAKTAVRNRAQQFLQMEVDRNFRRAESMVAKESKDAFYNGGRPAVKSFVIDDVELKDRKTALVRVHAGYLVVVPGVPAQVFQLPSTQTWKLEGGQWMYFIDLDAALQTPFGKLRSVADDSSSPAEVSALPNMSSPTGVIAPAGATLDNVVSISKNSVVLTESAPTQTLTIRNGLPGPVDLAFVGLSPHLSADIASQHLQAGEKCEVSIALKDHDAGIYRVRISVAPLGRQLEIEVTAK